MPADLWAPTPNVPVSGSLLWVYEGQTEFWGRVLAARSGQFTRAELRDRLAIEAAEIAARPGRAWRPLSDDVNYPAFMLRQRVPWRDWLDGHDELDTTSGLTRHGWRLVTEQPTAAFRAHEAEEGVADLTYSIGLSVAANGAVRAVAWDGPAFRAEIRPGVRIVAVNGAPFSTEALLDAVRGSRARPLELTVEDEDRRTERTVAYAGPPRYPRLEWIAGRPDTLTALLAPRPAD
jgi:predicted metalloprotease with PDZ domain